MTSEKENFTAIDNQSKSGRQTSEMLKFYTLFVVLLTLNQKCFFFFDRLDHALFIY
ncbi:Hypothetical predicted protein [Scomber scombrus]|uniref:Uncharacterized protein n=1 Tax=Scomber scombrus TaxID=13677 RepID=A0AAV1NQP6_SCOSC